MSTTSFSKNKKFNMDDPKDLAFIHQYMYASDDELSDCSSLASDEEFSGDDVADGSDESEDEINFHCDPVIDGDQQEEPVTTSVNYESEKFAHSNNENMGAQSTELVAASIDGKSATGLEKMSLSPGTDFALTLGNSFNETPKKSLDLSAPVPVGLTAMDIEEVKQDMSFKKKKLTTANDIIQYYNIKFCQKEKRAKALSALSKVLLKLKDEPGCAKTLWENECPNSHFCLRPLALILEKESADLIREMYKLYPESYKSFIVNIGKRPILVDVDIKRSMMDGKVQNIVSGRTGSYCHYCRFTAKTYYGKIINKNSEDPLSADLQFLTYEELIKAWDKIKGDLDVKSSKRLGFVHKPISKQEYMSVLHMIINCCRTMLKNIAIAVSDLEKNGIDPTKKKTESFNAKWKQSKVKICAVLLEKMKIRTMEIGRGNTGSGLSSYSC
ncbi:hypothetical protein ACHWQZ_G012228 [Mnemiopsis leidyi]